MAPQSDTVRVWDPFVRIFHWSVVALVSAAYYTAEWGQNETHLLLGYGLAGLITLRLIWGVIGTPYARFHRFIHGPAAVKRYWLSIRAGKPEHYLGHNPLGAWMVFALLGALVTLSVTGLILAGGLEYEGPFLSWVWSWSDAQIYRIEALHQWCVYGLFALVPLHIVGAIMASRQHRENLIKAMITGRKRSS